MKLDLDRVSRKIGPVVRLMNTAALDNLFAKSKITWRRTEPKRSGSISAHRAPPESSRLQDALDNLIRLLPT